MKAFAKHKVSRGDGALMVQKHIGHSTCLTSSVFGGNPVIISKLKITSQLNIHVLNRKRGKSTEDRKGLAWLEPHHR